MSLESLIDYRPAFTGLLNEFNDYFLEQGLKYKVRFKLPFYYGNTWIAYLNIPKPKRKNDPFLMELCFVRGRELFSGPELLDFKSREMIGGISFSEDSVIDNWEIINLLTSEAIELDRTKPYTFTKRKK